MGPEILIAAAVAALLLGPSQLPKLARSLGSAKRELQAGLEGNSTDETSSTNAS